MRALAVLAVCLALAACNDAETEDDGRTAGGQVLEGSISDSMLPLDTVRSQPPLAKVTGTPGEGGAGTETPDPDATDAAEDGESSPVSDAIDAAPEDDEG